MRVGVLQGALNQAAEQGRSSPGFFRRLLDCTSFTRHGRGVRLIISRARESASTAAFWAGAGHHLESGRHYLRAFLLAGKAADMALAKWQKDECDYFSASCAKSAQREYEAELKAGRTDEKPYRGLEILHRMLGQPDLADQYKRRVDEPFLRGIPIRHLLLQRGILEALYGKNDIEAAKKLAIESLGLAGKQGDEVLLKCARWIEGAFTSYELSLSPVAAYGFWSSRTALGDIFPIIPGLPEKMRKGRSFFGKA